MATGFGLHTMYREIANDVSDYITLLVKSRLIETQKLNAHHLKSNSNSFFSRMWKKCAFNFCVAITLLSINLCNLTLFVITLYIQQETQLLRSNHPFYFPANWNPRKEIVVWLEILTTVLSSILTLPDKWRNNM
jgi:hypothetical protein